MDDLEALLNHIEGMSHDHMAFQASAMDQFYYLANLKRLALQVRLTETQSNISS